VIDKFRIADHHCAIALIPLRQPQSHHHRRIGIGGRVEVAGPATAQPQGGGRQFQGSQGDGAGGRCHAVVFLRIRDDQCRCPPEDDVVPCVPPLDGPPDMKGLGHLRHIGLQPVHPVDDNGPEAAQLIPIAEHQPSRSLGVDPRGRIASHVDQLRKFFPFHRFFPVDPDGTAGAEEMFALLGLQAQLGPHRRTGRYRHIPMIEASRGTNRHAMPAADAGYLGVTCGNRQRALLPVDNTERADSGADAVSVAGFRIHYKKCHGLSPVVEIDRQGLRWFGTMAEEAVIEMACTCPFLPPR